MSTLPKIKPDLPGGFRDYLPQDMIPRQRMFDTIRAVYERYGYSPLDTPGLERTEVLTGNDPAFDMPIYRTSNISDQELALRFDLTVSLARVLALHPNDITLPFRRYHVGKVWRGEKPQAGRFREFVQFDADVVGSSSMLADAEIVALMHDTMVALGFERILIRVNDRKLLNGLPAFAGFPPEKTTGVLRAIDKLEKVGWEKVREELQNTPASAHDDTANDLSDDATARIKQFLDLRGAGKDDLLSDVERLLGHVPVAAEGIRELRQICAAVRAFGVPEDRWTIDLSVARGLGYYTGPVFETMLVDLPKIGSVFSGGRFDRLVERFTHASFPATGASIGVDRLFAAMEELKLVETGRTVTQVLVVRFNPAEDAVYQALAVELRGAGLPTEIYLGDEAAFKSQLAYATKQKIPVVLIVGPEELAAGTVQVKDMRRRTQDTVLRGNLLPRVRAILTGT